MEIRQSKVRIKRTPKKSAQEHDRTKITAPHQHELSHTPPHTILHRSNHLERGLHPSHNHRTSHTSTPSHLESGLHDVVAVAPSKLADVQRGAAGVDKGLEKVLHELSVEVAYALGWDGEVPCEVGPA